MKFKREEACQNLTATFKTKEENLDLTRTIKEAVDHGFELLGDNDTMELVDFCKIVEKQIATAVGLARHESSETAKELQEKIKELEKKGKQEPNPKPNETDESLKDNPVFKAMQEQLETLTKERNERKLHETVTEKKNAIVKKLSEKGVSDKKWINMLLDKANITENTDVDAEAEDYLKMYNTFVSDKGGGGGPGTPQGGGNVENKELMGELESLAKLK